MRVEVKRKIIPTRFLKIEGRRMFVGAKDQGERQLVELVGDQNPSPEVPPMSKTGRERWEQRRGQERSGYQRSRGEE